MMNKVKTGKIALAIIMVTLASKLLGFLRESIIASNFGASHETDAYVIAVTIYSIVSVVFWESINNAFVPQYISISKKDSNKANIFASNIMLHMLIITLSIVIIGELSIKLVINLIAPGFSDEVALLAQKLTRITLPVILVTGVSIIIGGILQANEKFLPQALMGIPNHIMVIVMLLVFGNKLGITGLTILTTIGTAIQIIVQLPFLRSAGFNFTPEISRTTAEYKLFYISIIPIFISTSARQINVLVDRALASVAGYGNISVLNYANTLNLAVIGLFISTVSTILYPYMASALQDKRKSAEIINESISKMIIIVLPITIAICMLKYELVSVAYERGSFSYQNALSVSNAFMYYSISLIPYGVTDILNKYLYILGHNRAAMSAGIASIFINVVFNFILIKPMGISGLALSTSISSFITMIMLIIFIKRNYEFKLKSLLRECIPLIIGGIIMATGMFVIKLNLDADIATGYKLLNNLIIAAVSIAVGTVLYVSVIYLHKKRVKYKAHTFL